MVHPDKKKGTEVTAEKYNASRARISPLDFRKGLVVGTEVGTAVTTNDVFALQGAPAPLATVPLDVLIRQLTSERYVPPHVYGLKVFPM